MGTSQIPGSSNPVCPLSGNRAKLFGGLKVELPSWLFSFTFSLSHLFFLLILFLSFCLAFVHRVHFYGKGLGKTFRIYRISWIEDLQVQDLHWNFWVNFIVSFSMAYLTKSCSFRLFLPAQVWCQISLWLFKLMAVSCVQSL